MTTYFRETLLPSLVFPLIYLIIALYCIAFIDMSLTFDAYGQVMAGRGILEGYGYVGLFANHIPPLYALLVAGVAPIFGLVTGAKVLTVFSTFGLLLFLPLLVNRIRKTILPGLILQVILISNPIFFTFSLQAENHMLEAFLYLGAVFCAVGFFQDKKLYFPTGFLIFVSLACLTRNTSYVVLFAFLATLIYQKPTRDRVWFTSKIFLAAFLVYSPWLFYNFFYGEFFHLTNRWKVIGFSFIRNGLMQSDGTEWFTYEMFNYSSFLDFFLQHPLNTILDFIIDFGKILQFTFYNFPPLGTFSILIGIGVFGLVFYSNRTVFLFLLFLMITQVMVVLLPIPRWIFFTHLFPVLAALGLSFLETFVKSINTLDVSDKLLAGACMVIFFVGGSLYQYEWMLGGFSDALSVNLRVPSNTSPVEKYDVYQKLRKLANPLRKDNDGRIRIMAGALSGYLGPIYQAGFVPIAIPASDLNQETPFINTICYKNMRNDRLRFIKLFNYPPGLRRHRYVPPEYALVETSFLDWVKKNKKIDESRLLNVLEEISYWERHKLGLFKVKKDKLNCFE